MNEPSVNSFCFVLGNFPELSSAEIISILKLSAAEYIYSPPFLWINKKIDDPAALISSLGGTIKIARFIGRADDENDLINIISENLSEIQNKKIFGLSYYSDGDTGERTDFAYEIGKTIKKHLTEIGSSARYVFNREAVLSSVTVAKNNLIKKGREFIIIKNEKGFILAQTLAVQPFEDWGARDYGRPGRDDLSGMLPPKLALMMLNLSGLSLDKTIFDPFCGSGTILSEAMTAGYKNIIGADISERAVSDTIKNIEWLQNRKPELHSEIKIFTADVGEINKKIPAKSVDGIIAEPYMGKPLKGNEPREILVNQTVELKQIYLQAFAEFKKILKPGGKIIFVIPRFRFKNDWIKIDCLKEIEAMGFKAESLFTLNKEERFSLLYWRSNQRVGREIWKFTARQARP
jgi:tRNA G10  N-methylase Trm11